MSIDAPARATLASEGPPPSDPEAPAFGFPIMLEVRGRRVLVVGGGREPAHKAGALAALGADVHVWAEEHLETAALAGRANVGFHSGRFDAGLFEGVLLAVIGSGDRALDRSIATRARARGVLVNTVDDIPYCDWSAPAILRRGSLLVTFSTSGIAPAMAVRMRDRLAGEVGPEHADLLRLFARARRRILATGRSFASRRRLWYQLVDGPALAHLRAAEPDRAWDAIERAIDAWESAG